MAVSAAADNRARLAARPPPKPSSWQHRTFLTPIFLRRRVCSPPATTAKEKLQEFATLSKRFEEEVGVKNGALHRSWKIYGPLTPAFVGRLTELLGGLPALRKQLVGMRLRLCDSSGEAFLSTPLAGYGGWVHLDAVSDVLAVLTGHKILYIAPPRFSEEELRGSDALDFATERTSTSPVFVYTEQKDFWKKRVLCGGTCTTNFDVSREALRHAPWIQVPVSAGELVFIPRGWLHAVDTKPATVALSLEVVNLA